MAGLETLALVASIAAPVASLTGTILASNAAAQEGANAQAVSNYQAAELERQGKAEQAIAAKRAAELKRRTRIEQSDARAAGAAFGGGVDYDVIGDLEEFGELDAMTALWEGREAAAGRNAQAQAARFEGQQRKKAADIRARSTLISGGASFFEKYGDLDF